jgi:acetyl-CoA/propionyl-CoA carboxylase biotin carboxyl carrier protein
LGENERGIKAGERERERDVVGGVVQLDAREALDEAHDCLSGGAIEQSPAPAVDAALRARIGEIATETAAAVVYSGAGTIEGLLQEGASSR